MPTREIEDFIDRAGVPVQNPECNLCPFGMDSPKRPTNICLFPPMPESCDVAIVAEQPYQRDDVAGEVFLGKELRQIKELFEEAGLSVYCTYAMKCARPARNVVPTGPQVKTCSNEYLKKEIRLLRPKHIVVLGANAYYGACGNKAGRQAQGNRHYSTRWDAYVYYAAHPIQAAYNLEVKKTLQAQMKLFLKWITTPESENIEFDPPVYIADSVKMLKNVQKMIRRAGGIVAVDTETLGLDQFNPKAYVRSIQFCWDPAFGGVFVPLDLEEDCYYTDPESRATFWPEDSLEDGIKVVREILHESQCIWHNGKFDRIWLHTWGQRRFGAPIVAPRIYMDTMHAAHLIEENRPLKLKQLITSELGYPTYDIPDKLTKDMTIFIPYATRDTVASYLLAQKYVEVLNG